jgi:GNAT superfamily N-acetyltransferase
MNTAKEIKVQPVEARGIKFSLLEDEQEVARAYLYIMHNELHQEPFGLLEDVYVDERYRGSGWGTKLVRQVITAAKKQNCYKLIATSRKSRPRVHQLYEKLGFESKGFEFRIDL